MPRLPLTISLRTTAPALVATLFVLTATEVFAQSKYAINWVSTGGASGTTTGVVYSVSRTTGSADADLMNGSVHTLAGSFWSGTVLAPQFSPDALYTGIDLNDPTQALADSDGDGLSNLMEYALGTDPRNPADAAGVLVFSITSSGGTQYLTMQFKRRKNATVLGLQYLPEVSADGQTWRSDSTNVVELSATAFDAQFDWVTVRDQTPTTPDSPRFFHLRVVKN
jgi:hypothetical protein